MASGENLRRQSFEVRGIASGPAGSGIDWDALRKMTVFDAVMETTGFMAVPFLMPSVFRRTGWVVGIVFLIFSTVVTYFTGTVLGDICVENPQFHTYPEIAEESFRRLAARYPRTKLRQEVWAFRGRIAVQLLQLCAYYLSGVAEIIYFQQYMAELLPDVPLCQRQWVMVVTLVVWPFSQMPTFKESRYIATLCVAMTLFNTGIFLYQVALVQPWNCDPAPEPAPLTPVGILSGITGIVYAYGGHGLYPEFLREMEDPRQWRTVLKWTFSLTVGMYIIVGMLGYYAYQGNAQANLNLNYPRNTANTISLVAQACKEGYAVVIPALVLMLQAELALRVDPTLWFSNKPSSEEASNAAADSTQPEPLKDWQPEATEGRLSRALTNLKSSLAQEEEGGQKSSPFWREVMSLRIFGVPPALFRLIFRSLFLGSQAFTAMMLLGGDGDILLSVQALAGALGYAALTYWLPIFFGWMLLPEPSPAAKVLQAISLVFCIFIMFVGVYFEVLYIIEAAGGFTSEVPCSIAPENFTGSGCDAANFLEL